LDSARFRDQGGRIIPDYDPKLAHALRDVDIERPLPTYGSSSIRFADVPMLVIRAQTSTCCSPATFEAMPHGDASARRCRADQGHAPLLTDDETFRASAPSSLL